MLPETLGRLAQPAIERTERLERTKVSPAWGLEYGIKGRVMVREDPDPAERVTVSPDVAVTVGV